MKMNNQHHGTTQVKQGSFGKAFSFDGELYNLRQMREANAHDEGFMQWLETAAVGDEFCGCERMA